MVPSGSLETAIGQYSGVWLSVWYDGQFYRFDSLVRLRLPLILFPAAAGLPIFGFMDTRFINGSVFLWHAHCWRIHKVVHKNDTWGVSSGALPSLD